MAVDAEKKQSIFTQKLADKLREEGMAVPPYVLDLLDKPFAAFSDDDRKLYETQVKQKELLALFARMLRHIYQAAGQSTRHSWKSLCHLTKDSPIKVCVSYIINQEEAEDAETTGSAAAGTARAVTPREAAGEEPGKESADASRKSFFTKKLERKLAERDIKVPAAITALLDKPFEDFSPEEQRLYEMEFKGRQLTILFSDLLDELYEETGRVASGWSAMCRYLKETPMKLIATYVIEEEERLEEVARREPEEMMPAQPAREKISVKRYQPQRDEQGEAQPRWRRK